MRIDPSYAQNNLLGEELCSFEVKPRDPPYPPSGPVHRPDSTGPVHRSESTGDPPPVYRSTGDPLGYRRPHR